MKFTPAELKGIEYDLEHAAQPLGVGTRRLLAFVKAELEDVIEGGPDTIELYFTNGYRMGTTLPNGANPFDRGYNVIKDTGGKL